MKLFTRCLILVIIMAIVSMGMYWLAIEIALPWVLNMNDGTYLTIFLILGVMIGLTTWVGICEFFGKILKCDELIDKFMNEK